MKAWKAGNYKDCENYSVNAPPRIYSICHVNIITVQCSELAQRRLLTTTPLSK